MNTSSSPSNTQVAPSPSGADTWALAAQLRPALLLFVLLSVVTGLAYPALMTGAAQALFPVQANGSLLMRQGQPVGSALLGQTFNEPRYFWSRPSATAPMPYNAAASSGSNLGPSNPALKAAVQERVAALRAADPTNTAAVPVDLVTASASGLDPHISRAAADYQAGRVAKERNLPLARVQTLVDQHTQGRWLGVLGEPRVNVLKLNLALDAEPSRQGEARPVTAMGASGALRTP